MLLGECFYITTAVFSGLNHLLDQQSINEQIIKTSLELDK